MKVCVGGTFDRLHAAHRALLDRAFDEGDEVFIGVMEDAVVRKKKGVLPYAERTAALESYLVMQKYSNYRIIPINRPSGIADRADFDGIVVSEESRKNAMKINIARKRRRLKPLSIFLVDRIYAEDLIPISSTRIRNGTIDPEGRRLTPLAVNVGSTNRNKVRAVRNVFGQAFRDARFRVTVRGVRVRSGVPEQPFEGHTVTGAQRRARGAIAYGNGLADFGVGIEAGIFRNRHLERHFDVQFCAICDSGMDVTIGHGGGFMYPEKVMDEILGGKSVSAAMGTVFDTPDLGEAEGAVGFLSKGFMTRERLTEQAVAMALIPRFAGRVDITNG